MEKDVNQKDNKDGLVRKEVTKDGGTREYFENGFVIDTDPNGVETIHCPRDGGDFSGRTIKKFPDGEIQMLEGPIIVYDSRRHKEGDARRQETKDAMKESLNGQEKSEELEGFEYKQKDEVSNSDATTKVQQTYKGRD